MTCPLCDAGDEGNVWSKDILLGRKNIAEASRFFNTTNSVVLEHVNKHYKPQDTVTGNSTSDCVKDRDFYLNELHMLLKQLKDWTNYCIRSSNMGTRDIELLLKLVKETRDTIKTLGEFEGRINKQSQVQVNIALVNQRYSAIEHFLLNDTCDECRLKVIDLMDSLAQQTDLITSGQ